MESAQTLETARHLLAFVMEIVMEIRGFEQMLRDEAFYRSLENLPQYDDRRVAVFNEEVIGVNVELGPLLDEVYVKFGENMAWARRWVCYQRVYSKNPTPEIAEQRRERLESDRQYLEGLSPLAYRGQWVAVKGGKVLFSHENPLVFFEKIIKSFSPERRKYVAFKQFPA